MTNTKKRLDQLLVDNGLAADLRLAQGMIGAGEVLVNECIADKAGQIYPESSIIRVKEKCPYVSRGGFKLEKAIQSFPIHLEGYFCLDVGASSGGFTDCLLQHGAARVYAVDVAYGQLDWKVRQDERVVVVERFNARNLSKKVVPEPIQLAVMDTSFISITRIIPALLPLFDDKVRIISLIKPQFELPKDQVGQGGVVRDPALHKDAIRKIQQYAETLGLIDKGVVTSPIKGPKGNTEFLIYLESAD